MKVAINDILRTVKEPKKVYTKEELKENEFISFEKFEGEVYILKKEYLFLVYNFESFYIIYPNKDGQGKMYILNKDIKEVISFFNIFVDVHKGLICK